MANKELIISKRVNSQNTTVNQTIQSEDGQKTEEMFHCAGHTDDK